MPKLSRRKIAEYVANTTKDGVVPTGVIAELAAYLADSHRTRELPLVVRTIEDVLAERGQVVARVTTARGLDDSIKQSIRAQINAKEVYFAEAVDPSVIGGVRVETPGKTLDATIIRKLNSIRSAKAS
ncbi:F0F1 ATP synthase subunit delta [Candidatus Saccharibacteria bacterium]|jgi:F-type H+-transporting ATPase subunit delta|nr:F0F1 ATP synthase subunit delta [Candidatus Saccharibacteria bacterium]HPR09197.1 F0F1 ATP synthase subunit delta [Candidatus Saccharibacteria bacterium]